MPIELTAPITAVTVYTNRARVTRSASMDLEPGETTLVLFGLPEVMDADSVRVSGKGAGITIRGVDVKPDVQEEPKSSQALNEQQAQLEKQKRAIEHEQKSLDTQFEYLKYVQNYTGANFGDALVKGTTPLDRVVEVSQFLHNQLAALYTKQREVQERYDAVMHEIQQIRARISNPLLNTVAKGQAIHIAVDVEAPVTFDIEVDYLVRNVWWKALYDVRLLADKSVELTYMASIAQTTCEDWEDVSLSLSTARPALQSTLPKLEAWYIDDPVLSQYFEAKYRQAEARQEARGSVLAKRTMVEPQPKPVAKVQQAEVQTSTTGAVVTYTVGTPVSIPGNGEPHKTTIVITGLKAELDYLTAPRLAPEAYLRATITNTSAYTLLPGEASVFHENDFVGKTQLATIAPNDEFKVQLGVDDRIKIERELVKRDTSSRFIGTMAQTNFQYVIKLKNLLAEKAKVTVQDQFPVSKSSKINVKLDSVSPKPNDETDLHILTWELELEPQQEQTINLAFTVEHGRNQPVYGLDD